DSVKEVKDVLRSFYETIVGKAAVLHGFVGNVELLKYVNLLLRSALEEELQYVLVPSAASKDQFLMGAAHRGRVH
ncbi:hypothetical protein PFISCL1PPCAC_28946, partial [Pristionchus fissidentatus]